MVLFRPTANVELFGDDGYLQVHCALRLVTWQTSVF